MTIHYAKAGQDIIGGCTPAEGDRTFRRWGAVDDKGTQVDCASCLAFRPRVEDDAFIAMIQRHIRTLEERAVENPAILAQVIMLAQRLAEIPNVVIALSGAKYAAEGPHAAPSVGEIGAMLGMKKQSASDRRKIGERILFERSMGEQTITQRERQARTLAAKHAAETLAGWLERREVQA